MSIYQYGEDKISGNKIAVVTGGGVLKEVLEEIVEREINILLRGITVNDKLHKDAQAYAL